MDGNDAIGGVPLERRLKFFPAVELKPDGAGLCSMGHPRKGPADRIASWVVVGGEELIRPDARFDIKAEVDD